MATVHCSKCKQDTPALSEAPLPGELGQKVLQHTCEGCWQSWVGQQLMLMNEYRLDPLNDEHGKFLDDEMVKFLALS